jgi:predicted DNA-binding ribbon-helix-helix protein
MHAMNLNTALICRNVTVSGRRTSIRMEQVMWTSLTDICRREDRTINEIISAIDEKRAETNLTAAIRVFIICYYRDATLNIETKHGFAEDASFDSLAETDSLNSIEHSSLINTALDVVGVAKL